MDERQTRPATSAKDPWLGATLDGRYRVLRKIAEGGMGAVYEGEQVALKRRVAIKVLHAHLARDADIVVRFRREALATTQIGHPHIVEVLDLGEMDDGSLFMVLELLEGRDLARVLKDEGPLPVARAAKIVAQVCEGVAAAHAKGIVHRDLKPENVFLTTREGDPTSSADSRTDRRDFVKVLDFGVSKIRDSIDGADARTRTGTALGTPYYMAPEQAQGKRDVDHRADVYAIGVILFRILTGHHPFDDTSYPMLVLKICTEPAPRIAEWRTDVPRELVALVERMLAKEPSERPSSIASVRDALLPLRAIHVAPVLTGAAAPTTRAPSLLESRDHSPAAMAATQRRMTPEEEEEDAAAASRVAGSSRAPMLAGLALLGLLTIAIVTYAITDRDPEVPREPDPIALPTPRDPVTRALAPRGGDGGGWTWLNPRPRAMPTWYDVDVGGPGLVVLVGQDGAAARFLNGLLVTWRSGSERSLRSVAWVSDDSALAVGDEGTIVRLTPQGPRPITSGTAQTLRAVLPISSLEALIAGDGGTLLRVRGEDVSALDTGTTVALTAAHERGDLVWVVGERGTILRFADGTRATEDSGLGVTLRAIGGCASGDLYAGGDQATLLRRRATGAWQNVRTALDTGESITSITCDRGRAAIVGSEGTVLLASGTNVVRMPSGFDRGWHGVSGARDETTWIAGAGGRIATIEEDYVRTATAGPTVPLRDVAMIGGALVAVGEWGRIVREREHGFEESTSPTDAGLAALAAIDESRLLAVGDLGAIVEVRWDGATLVQSPTDASLRDVLIGADGRVLVVGTGGTLVRGTVESLSASRVRDAGDLWAIAGTPDEAIAVGDGGTVVRITSSGAERVGCETERSLRAVLRTPEGTWAVGEAGTIVRIGASGCTREHDGGATLDAIALGPDGRPLAVGERGTALARSADGTWSPIELDLGGNHAREIERLGRHVYVVGTGGVIVRHVIADGT
ncbi:protein kinase domain-containing protein [Sandaracinus amylolyticus]|uniref:protein kinase domain-containing protein n=1 Tax=Sandaracinus amylolyticus TaxID=927083 RepID=UPI001F00D989|nr:protein kinase [Sandaracinus amylolyticus]